MQHVPLSVLRDCSLDAKCSTFGLLLVQSVSILVQRQSKGFLKLPNFTRSLINKFFPLLCFQCGVYNFSSFFVIKGGNKFKILKTYCFIYFHLETTYVCSSSLLFLRNFFR